MNTHDIVLLSMAGEETLPGVIGDFHGTPTINTPRGTRYVDTFREWGWEIELVAAAPLPPGKEPTDA
jgi:hypothetical protein